LLQRGCVLLRVPPGAVVVDFGEDGSGGSEAISRKGSRAWGRT
jgi:hypothetical protein